MRPAKGTAKFLAKRRKDVCSCSETRTTYAQKIEDARVGFNQAAKQYSENETKRPAASSETDISGARERPSSAEVQTNSYLLLE